MNNFVISLKSAIERRAHIIDLFGKENIQFEFFDAVTYSNCSQTKIQETISDLFNNNVLTSGEKGCLLSHLFLYQKCINENLPYITIFEDDVILGTNAKQFFVKDQWLKERFDLNNPIIVRFETFLTEVETRKAKVESYLDHEFRVLTSEHWGTAGYLISQAAAKYILNLCASMRENNIVPIDQLIFNKLLNQSNITVYQLSPAIVIQEMQLKQETSILKSSIENERLMLKMKETDKQEICIIEDKERKTLYGKIQREIFRIKRKILRRNYKVIKFI